LVVREPLVAATETLDGLTLVECGLPGDLADLHLDDAKLAAQGDETLEVGGGEVGGGNCNGFSHEQTIPYVSCLGK